MIDRSVNTPLTSSCGRLFDATASLLGIAQIASSEGAAAIALEKKASTVEDSGDYPFEIASREGVYRALHAPLVEAMVGDLERGTPVDNVARRFHNSLARLVLEMARRIGRDACVRTVALSGGVFQNRLLHSMARDLLARDGFRVLESGVPVNDLGICVGQTYMASRQL
jgi:hydrogenase maturation protein HypF